MTKEKLYPIRYDGKLYYEKDCDSCFSAFYTCKEALNGMNGVYMSEGLWVYPDGSMGEW
jgi:Zn-finger protein